MIWLIQELWWVLLVAVLAGFALTWLWMVRTAPAAPALAGAASGRLARSASVLDKAPAPAAAANGATSTLRPANAPADDAQTVPATGPDAQAPHRPGAAGPAAAVASAAAVGQDRPQPVATDPADRYAQPGLTPDTRVTAHQVGSRAVHPQPAEQPWHPERVTEPAQPQPNPGFEPSPSMDAQRPAGMTPAGPGGPSQPTRPGHGADPLGTMAAGHLGDAAASHVNNGGAPVHGVGPAAGQGRHSSAGHPVEPPPERRIAPADTDVPGPGLNDAPHLGATAEPGPMRRAGNSPGPTGVMGAGLAGSRRASQRPPEEADTGGLPPVASPGRAHQPATVQDMPSRGGRHRNAHPENTGLSSPQAPAAHHGSMHDAVMRSASGSGSSDAHGFGNPEVPERPQAAPQPARGRYVADAGAAAAAAPGRSARRVRVASGAVKPLAGGVPPSGYPVKGDTAALMYYTPGTPGYDKVTPDVCFDSEATAQHAGFRHRNVGGF